FTRKAVLCSAHRTGVSAIDSLFSVSVHPYSIDGVFINCLGLLWRIHLAMAVWAELVCRFFHLLHFYERAVSNENYSPKRCGMGGIYCPVRFGDRRRRDDGYLSRSILQ